MEQSIVHHVRHALGLANGTTAFNASMLRGGGNSAINRHLAALGRWNIFPSSAFPTPMRGGADSTDSPPAKPPASAPKKRKETQLGCAWSAAVTAATYNVAFPDLNCVYQVLLYWGVTGKTTLRIDGQFPRVRYFSFQSYDLQSGTPIASLIDYEIEASKGINPFKTVPSERGGKWGANRANDTRRLLDEEWDYDSYEGSASYERAGYGRKRSRKHAQAGRGRSRGRGEHSEDDHKDSPSSWKTASKEASSISSPSSEATSSSYGSYQVHVTDTGNRGFPNELAASSSSAGRSFHRQCGGKGCVALVILRLYTAEPGEDAFHHRHQNQEDDHHVNAPSRLWGYVPPPEVSVRYGAWVNEWTGKTMERYKVLEPCHDEKTTVVKSFLDWKIPQMQGDWSEQSALDNLDDNFVVYTPSSSSRALFANADASYLFATARNNRSVSAADQGSGPQRKELVARITGYLPTVAHGFTEPQTVYGDEGDEDAYYYDDEGALQPHRVIADLDSYEARYVSLSTIALKGAGPVIDTVMDVVMEQKYRWQEGWDLDRQFSVVAAPGTRLLDRCPPRVYRSDRDLFLKTVQPGESEPPAHLAFLYRQILSQWQTRGRLDKSIARAKHECLGRNDGGHACKLRSFFVDLMGPQYPSIKYFYCWENVTRGCSCEDSMGQLVGWEDEDGIDEEDDDWWGLPNHHHHHHHNHGHHLFEDDGRGFEHYPLDLMQGSDGKASNISNDNLVTANSSKPVSPLDQVKSATPVELVNTATPAELVTSVAPVELVNTISRAEPVAPAAPVELANTATPADLVAPAAPVELVNTISRAESVALVAPVELVNTATPADIVVPAATVELVNTISRSEPAEPVAPVQSLEPVTVAAPVAPMKTVAPVSPVPVDSATTESSTVLGVPAQQTTLNASSLSGRVPPDAWKQTQAYYNYMQHQKDRSPLVTLDEHKSESKLLVALDDEQTKESKPLVAVEDVVSEQQQWQQQQLLEQQEQMHQMQYEVEEQQYQLEEQLQQEDEYHI